MAGTRSILDIILRFTKKGKGAEEAAAGAKKVGKSVSTSAKEMVKGTGAALKFGTELFAAGAAAVFAAQKILDVGRQGAAIEQTGQSFDFLASKIGAPIDLLEQMTAATKGTVSELELMQSVQTLVAGASDEVAGKMAAASPRLAEIAKAANKLNPALGETGFLFQSLGTGIKRASPLILDNLGLTIKVGEANATYAESIGKTVDELSAMDKQMALLEATLVAGDALIAQVGGNTDSATDAFDRMGTTIANKTNAALVDLGNFLEGAAVGIDVLVGGADELHDVFQTHQADMREAAIATGENSVSLDEYNTEIIRSGKLTGDVTQLYDARTAAQLEGLSADELAAKGIFRLGEEYFDLGENVKILTQVEIDGIRAGREMQATLDESAEHMFVLADAAGATASGVDLVAQAQTKLKDQMSLLNIMLQGPVAAENEKFNAAQSENRAEAALLTDELAGLQEAHGGLLATTNARALSDTQLALKQSQLADAQAALGEVQDQGSTQALALKAKIEKLSGAISGASATTTSWVDNSERIGEIEGDLTSLDEAYRQNAETHEQATKRILFNIAMQRVDMKTASAEQIGALFELGAQWGLLDEESGRAARGMIKAIDSVDFDTIIQGANDTLESLMALPAEVPIRITISTVGGIPNMPGPGAGPVALQHGFHGFTTEPTLFLTSEHGQLERVDVTPGLGGTQGGRGGRGLGRTNVNVNFVYSPMMSSGDMIDFQTRIIPMIARELRLAVN